MQLIRRYGLYSSHTKGRWSQMPHVAARAPEGWRASHMPEASAWARLLAKVYEIDPLVCRKCGWEYEVQFGTAELQSSAVIQDPVEIRDILTHQVKTGRAPPGFDPTLPN